MAKEKDTNVNKGKLEAVQTAMDLIQKAYGKGSIMKLGEGSGLEIETFSSGSLLVDKALGGGYAKGRIIEIYGPESSGKTTLTLHAIAEIQKEGGVAAFIDAEHALDPSYAQKLGVNLDDLLISQPDYGEQALEIVEKLASSGAIDLIVVDSVAALTPKAEIEGDMGDSHMGLQARLMSQALRKLTATVSKTNCTVIFINQLRMKIGVMFGSPETTTGGNSLKFYASQRIDIRRKSKIERGSGDNKEAIGSETVVKVIKNKIAPPFREANIEIMYNQGISKVSEIIDLGVEYGLISKSGAFYYLVDETAPEGKVKLGQGKENVKEYILNTEGLFEDLDKKIKELLKKD